MSVLVLYAIAPPAVPGSEGPDLGQGLAGEPLRAIPCGNVMALVGEMSAPPPLTRESLGGQDAAVRRLAELFPALLPVRFGEHVAGEANLAARLAPRATELAEALERVAGCVQMTLRVFRTASSLPGKEAGEALPVEQDVPREGEAEVGPGTRYLAARRRALERERSVPEIAPLRVELGPLIRGERVERTLTPQEVRAEAALVATVYHLIARSDLEAYTRALAAGSEDLSGIRVAASGPWPPYAFAPRPGDSP